MKTIKPSGKDQVIIPKAPLVATFLVAMLLGGCALFSGEPGQQQAAAVLISCEPLQNGGRIPGPGCEQETAEKYQQYSNDLKDARKQ